MANETVSRKKTIWIFIVTIIGGFFLFALPNIFFGVTKINGGLSGINLLYIALFQFTAVCSLLLVSLKLLKKDVQYIGWSWKEWRSDSLLGLITGLLWAALQFGVIIPNTGGAERADITQMVSWFDGTFVGILSFIALGIIGGGITEEIYNRGYFINVLKDTFNNPTTGTWIAATLSILFFALGHLPGDALGWVDILIPTIIYTFLFLYTKRLAASIVSHSIYNMTAILLTYHIYYP